MDAKIISLTINCRVSFLNPAMDEELENFAEKIKATEKERFKHVIILELVGPYAGTAYSESDVSFLEDQVTLGRLYQKLSYTRNLLRQVKRSQHDWIFIARQDTLGVWAEFALACRHVFFTNSELRLGFPEISIGAFPCLGSVEDLCISGSWLKKELEEKPVRRSFELVNAAQATVLTRHNEKDQILGWLERQLGGVPKASKILGTIPLALSNEAFEHLSSLHPVPNPSSEHQKPWRIVWDAIRQKHWSKSESEFISLTIFQHARFLLSRVFLRWAKRYTLQTRVSLEVPQPEKLPVVIDLEYLSPPVHPLSKLIEQKFVIIFWSSEVSRLKEALDLSFARFERLFGRERAHQLWRTGVTSVHADRPLPVKHCMLQWCPDDNVRIKTPDSDKTFLRFNSNRGNTMSGWCEHSTPVDRGQLTHNSAMQFARVISNGVILTRPIGTISLSCYVRSLFLQELLKLSRMLQGGLPRIMPSLKDYGWGFVSEDNSWEYFLRSREEIYSVNSKMLHVGPLTIQDSFWQLGIFKEAKEISRRSEEKMTLVVPARVSHYFATFAGLIAKVIAEQKLTENYDEADLFVAEVLGFPASFGTPLTYARELGMHRAQFYWQQMIMGMNS